MPLRINMVRLVQMNGLIIANTFESQKEDNIVVSRFFFIFIEETS